MAEHPAQSLAVSFFALGELPQKFGNGYLCDCRIEIGGETFLSQREERVQCDPGF